MIDALGKLLGLANHYAVTVRYTHHADRGITRIQRASRSMTDDVRDWPAPNKIMRKIRGDDCIPEDIIAELTPQLAEWAQELCGVMERNGLPVPQNNTADFDCQFIFENVEDLGGNMYRAQLSTLYQDYKVDSITGHTVYLMAMLEYVYTSTHGWQVTPPPIKIPYAS